MAKKSFFEKLGLVESTEPEISTEDLQKELRSISEEPQQTTIEIQDIPEDMLLEDVITVEEVYEKFGLTQMETSIFKVDEFLSVLPKELPNDAKKTSVLGILSASGLSLDSLLNDATSRQSALLSTFDAFTNETNSIVDTKKAEIEDLEQKIDQLKTEINDRKKAQESQEDIVMKEKEKIQNIVNFIQ